MSYRKVLLIALMAVVLLESAMELGVETTGKYLQNPQPVDIAGNSSTVAPINLQAAREIRKPRHRRHIIAMDAGSSVVAPINLQAAREIRKPRRRHHMIAIDAGSATMIAGTV